MYKLLLILKYLRKRRIAWVSLIAVMLCTAMVLVVISVMGGWLRMFRSSFHGLSGDVIVHGQSLTGFPYYQEMIERIEKIPDVAAAVPTLRTFGLINIANQKPDGVQVQGIPIDRIGLVNQFPQSLWRQHVQWTDKVELPIVSVEEKSKREKERQDLLRQEEKLKWEEERLFGEATAEPALSAKQKSEKRRYDLRRRAAKLGCVTQEEHDEAARKAKEGLDHPSFDLPLSPEAYKIALPKATNDVTKYPGIIAGVGVLNIHKNEYGEIENRGPGLYHLPVRLTVMGMSPEGFKDDLGGKTDRVYWIVDDSRTQIWQYDSNTVYVPFEILQRNLGMDAGTETSEDGKTQTTTPARTSDIQVKVRLKAGQSQVTRAQLLDVKDQVQRAVNAVMSDKGVFMPYPPEAQTWEESQAMFLGAVEKEKALVTFLFGMISIVAIFLIFCIFYMIVVEKTHDIGIIKSVGATSGGVAGIFLGYGLAIGIVGSACGLLMGWLIVHNINELHTWMGRVMGIQIWNPAVYAFDTIPNTMDVKEVSVILIVAIVSSVFGALVPAFRAAGMDPVESLRWE